MHTSFNQGCRDFVVASKYFNFQNRNRFGQFSGPFFDPVFDFFNKMAPNGGKVGLSNISNFFQDFFFENRWPQTTPHGPEILAKTGAFSKILRVLYVFQRYCDTYFWEQIFTPFLFKNYFLLHLSLTIIQKFLKNVLMRRLRRQNTFLSLRARKRYINPIFPPVAEKVRLDPTPSGKEGANVEVRANEVRHLLFECDVSVARHVQN